MKRLFLLIAGLTAFGFVFAQTASAALTNRYVVKNNPGAAAPYDSLANAAGDIQTAINYAYTVNNETVLVAAAVYDTGGTKVNYTTNRVYISKAITVRSINNDPANTIIKGARDPVTTNGWLAIRCVYMVDNSKLIGFTLTNGATLSSNEVVATTLLRDANGGGVLSATPSGAGVTVSNCIIAGNTAYGNRSGTDGGGGVNGGTYFNCQFLGNSTPYRGGAAAGQWSVVLSNCVIAGNTAGESGGAAQAATLYNCIVSNNSAAYGGGILGRWPVLPSYAYNCTFVGNTASKQGGVSYNDSLADRPQGVQIFNSTMINNTALQGGGAVFYGLAVNCLVVSNLAAGGYNGGGLSACVATNCTVACNVAYRGGGATVSTLNNCLLYGNQAVEGGGVYQSSLINCTVVGNYASGSVGGGLASPAAAAINVINSVIYSNQAVDPNYHNWSVVSGGVISFTNSCTIPTNGTGLAASSMNNTTNDPRLIAYGAGYGTNLVPGNYRLQASSPCVNGGLNQSWMTNAVDLDGRMRIRYGTVDMGAYEAIYDGTIYKFR